MRKEDVPPGIQTHELQVAEDKKPWHFDEGKPQFELIPQWGLLELARVATYGRTKYGKHNYQDYANNWHWLEPTGSILRHVFAFLRGEWLDTESGLPHLAHAAFNALMIVDLFAFNKGIDDRSPFAKERDSDPEMEPLYLATPEEVEEAQIQINKEWTDRIDRELARLHPRRSFGKEAFETHWAESDQQYEPLPDEELHDDLTFPAFAPGIEEYWRNKLANEAKIIVCGYEEML